MTLRWRPELRPLWKISKPLMLRLMKKNLKKMKRSKNSFMSLLLNSLPILFSLNPSRVMVIISSSYCASVFAWLENPLSSFFLCPFFCPLLPSAFPFLTHPFPPTVIFLGEQNELLVAFKNNYPQEINITAIRLSIMHPMEPSFYYLQNCTPEFYYQTIAPETTKTFHYEFVPDAMLQPRAYVVVTNVYFEVCFFSLSLSLFVLFLFFSLGCALFFLSSGLLFCLSCFVFCLVYLPARLSFSLFIPLPPISPSPFPQSANGRHFVFQALNATHEFDDAPAKIDTQILFMVFSIIGIFAFVGYLIYSSIKSGKRRAIVSKSAAGDGEVKGEWLSHLNQGGKKKGSKKRN